MFDFLSKKFSDIFSRLSGKHCLSEANIAQVLKEVQGSMIEADVPYQVVEQFVVAVKEKAIGEKVLSSVKPGEQFVKIVHDQLVSFMGEATSLHLSSPAIVMVMGLQGSGKTTSLAKIAHWMKKKEKFRKILLASVDFYRPAAVEQLSLLADSVGCSFYVAQQKDPVEAAREIAEHYKRERFDLLLLDTAGRLHVDDGMMAELQEINKLVNPDYKLLVLDAMTGQESLCVAERFNERIGFDGAILTKLDSETRGGAAFAFRYMLKKPIVFVGSGEKTDDLEQFKPERAAGRILGMGDVLSLVEKAQERVKHEEQEALERSMKKGRITLEDFARQLEMVNAMGSLGSLMKYMPGMGGMNVSSDMVEKADEEMKRFKAIINSMTPKERKNHRILDLSRKKRIAKGAGVELSAVNLLIDRFEQSQQYVKLFKKLGRF